MRNNAKRAPPGLLARTRTHVLRFLAFLSFLGLSIFFFSLFHSFSFSFLHREKAKRLDLNDTSILKKRKKKLMPLLDKDV